MRFTSLVLILSMLAAAPVAAQGDAPARIAVQGHGEASARPDLARVTLGVTVEDGAANAATGRASAAMAEVFAALGAAGIAEEDLRTLSIALSPIYDRDRDRPPRLVGWRAAQEVQATLRDVDALGPVIDAAIGAGATDVGAIGFDLSDRTALRDAARKAAVADARAAADLLAGAAGVTLGPLLSLSLGGGVAPPPVFRAEAMAMDSPAPAPPVAAGSLTVRASVSAVYAIE